MQHKHPPTPGLNNVKKHAHKFGRCDSYLQNLKRASTGGVARTITFKNSYIAKIGLIPQSYHSSGFVPSFWQHQDCENFGLGNPPLSLTVRVSSWEVSVCQN